MKRKTIGCMLAATLMMSLSACGKHVSFPLGDILIEKEAKKEGEIKQEEKKEEAKKEETEEVEEETAPEETEEDPAEKEIEKVQAAIDGIPYYGDTANCKMTAEQATAFAQLIADGLAGDFSFRGGYDERYDIVSWGEPFQIYTSEVRDPNEVDRFHVMLGDFADDGVPYLYVCSSTIERNNDIPSFEIYGWRDNTSRLVVDTHSGTSTIAWETYDLYEDKNDQSKIKLLFNTGYGVGESSAVYSFSEGVMEESHVKQADIDQDGLWHITEDGVETGTYTEEGYRAGHEVLVDVQGLKDDHIHTLPYTCFYEMTPCSLEEMVDHLNAYASAVSDGQSVPVEITEVKGSIGSNGSAIDQEGFLIQILQKQQEEIERSKNKFPAYDAMSHVGELMIINDNRQTSADSGLSYSIDGNDIVYDGTRYTDLYSNAKDLESCGPFDADTMIKCLLLGYPSPEETVFTSFGLDDGADEYTIPIDDSIYAD